MRRWPVPELAVRSAGDCRVRESRDGGYHVTELAGQAVLKALPSPPCLPALLADGAVSSKTLRAESDELEFAGPVCNLRDIDLGIAVGSAAKTATLHSIDCRCQTRAAIAARKLGYIQADHAVAPYCR